MSDYVSMRFILYCETRDGDYYDERKLSARAKSCIIHREVDFIAIHSDYCITRTKCIRTISAIREVSSACSRERAR